MMKNTYKNYQSGNAIVIIFIAIALFAALAVVFNQSSRTSTGFISDSQANTYANQIISYGNQVKDAVKRLQLRGCADTQISFENNTIAGYVNGNAPTDEKCHVFSSAGGGLSWNNPSSGINNGENWFFSGRSYFYGVGTTGGASGAELWMSLIVNREICYKLTSILLKTPIASDLDITEGSLNITNPGSYLQFQGSYNTGTGVGDDADLRDISENELSYCIWMDDTDQYLYAKVLLAR